MVGMIPILVIGTNERMSFGIATTNLCTLHCGNGNEGKLVEPFDNPLKQSQKIRAVLIEFEDRLDEREGRILRQFWRETEKRELPSVTTR